MQLAQQLSPTPSAVQLPICDRVRFPRATRRLQPLRCFRERRSWTPFRNATSSTPDGRPRGLQPLRSSARPTQSAATQTSTSDARSTQPAPHLTPPAPAAPTKDELQQAIQAALDPSNTQPFPWSLQQLLTSLHTSQTSGQPNNEAHLAGQRELFGVNALPQARSVTFWELVLDALGDFTLLMLLVAGVVSLLLAFLVPGAEPEDWIEGAAILASAGVVVLVAATTNFQKEAKFRQLNSMKDDIKVRVVRGGRERQVSVRDVVVGDLVVVEGGDILPADGLLMPGGQLKLDESHLTGESEDVTKGGVEEEGGPPVVYSGSKVLEGFGRVLVLAVGVCSQQGVIGSLVMGSGGVGDAGPAEGAGAGAGAGATAGGAAQGRDGQGQVVGLQEDTLLMQKLDNLAKAIGGLGVAAAGGVLALNLGGLAWDLAMHGEQLLAVNHLQEYLSCVLNAITVLVVAVPEGLPLAVTLALAFSVQRMLADNTLVRHLAACETMASTTSVLSDKTGTLTENNMRVVRLWAGGSSFRVRPSSTPTPSRTATRATPPPTPPPPPPLLRPLGTRPPPPNLSALTMVSLSVDEADPRAASPPPSSPTPQGTNGAAAAAMTAASLSTVLMDTRAPGPLSGACPEPCPPAMAAACGSLLDVGDATRLGGLPLPRALVDPLLMNITLNSTACVQVASRGGNSGLGSSASGNSGSFDGCAMGNGGGSRARLDMAGNRTECALLEFAMRLDPALLHVDALRQQFSILQVLPFTSLRKSMTTAVVPSDPLLSAVDSSGGQGGAAQVFTKGAAEVVLKRCQWQLDAGGNVVPLPEAQKHQLLDSFSREGLRVLALANKLTSTHRAGGLAEQLEEEVASGLVLVGMVGLEDPLRADVPLSVARCHKAGITVRMLTGDNPVTAVAIARQCGILPAELEIDDALAASRAVRKVEGRVVGLPEAAPGREPVPLAIEAPRLRELITKPGGKLDEQALLAVWPHLRVVARCTPTDKYLLVAGAKKLRSKGLLHEVLAVTGDGTNDAPALRAADVGFAMNSGTGIAKEAADILLLDDSFSSVVAAARWGRNVYAGISRFLQFQLTANVVAVATAALGAVCLRESPLTAVQMLWVNLIMDSLASLALATEPPTDELLQSPPVGIDQPLVSADVGKHISGQAVLQLAVMAVLVLRGEALLGVDQATAHTLVFNTFVWLQLFNQINCRRVRDEPNPFQGVLRSPLFLSIWVVEAALQVLIVEYGGKAFQTVPLEPRHWLACLSIGALSLLARTVLRRLPSPTLRLSSS